MIAGNWCLYERRSSRWLFRVLGTPLLTLVAMLVLGASAWLGYL